MKTMRCKRCGRIIIKKIKKRYRLTCANALNLKRANANYQARKSDGNGNWYRLWKKECGIS